VALQVLCGAAWQCIALNQQLEVLQYLPTVVAIATPFCWLFPPHASVAECNPGSLEEKMKRLKALKAQGQGFQGWLCKCCVVPPGNV